jgi:hypothetical protein
MHRQPEVSATLDVDAQPVGLHVGRWLESPLVAVVGQDTID